ncbi:MAG: heme o synthase [Planctomycetota bacterium]
MTRRAPDIAAKLRPEGSPLVAGSGTTRAVSALPGSVPEGSGYTWRDRARDYKVLVKPSITRLVVITAAIGFALGVRSGAGWTWLMLVGTLAGTGLSCMAASVFNQAFEWRTDAMMPRTRQRPLAAGRLPMAEALALGGALMLIGQAALCMFGTPLASGLAAFTILTYALVYTPLKRVSPMSLYVGAIPGALPPLIGYTAVTGSLFTPAAATAWAVFLIMALWQVPHFLAIGYLYKEDYAAADLAMHAVRDPSGKSSLRNAILGGVLLLPAGLLPTLWGDAGWWAFGVSLICGLLFLGLAIRWACAADSARKAWARRVFFASLIYLPVVLTAVMVDAR